MRGLKYSRDKKCKARTVVGRGGEELANNVTPDLSYEYEGENRRAEMILIGYCYCKWDDKKKRSMCVVVNTVR